MALPDILTGLLRPAAYPHPCTGIRLLETHISWVLLTGDYAYKIKKPVQLPFVDFSSLERRYFFCQEELRCNRRFAPQLYLEVVPIGLDADGAVMMGGAVEPSSAPVEWAVRMRQFPPERQLDRLLESGLLTTGLLRDFGGRLAEVHRALPPRSGPASEIDARVRAPVEENFTTIAGLPADAETHALLLRARAGTERLSELLDVRFAERLAGGFTRECHGDLHLGNLVLEGDAVTAFDCLEFDANLRWIDIQSDVAFLFMDCLVRGRADLGYAFLDGYLDVSGDYEGVALLPFYAAYRALVRAKVAGIQALQARAAGEGRHEHDDRPAAVLRARMMTHLRWAAEWLERPPGRVVLMSGVSGSGKSYLAERLVAALPAVRMRSDVARRHLAAPTDRAMPSPRRKQGHLDAGRYAPEQVLAVYRYLVDLMPAVVEQGESVILDATFISRAARDTVAERARNAGWRVVIVACHAPVPILEARVRQRLADGSDPSEADLAVLAGQLARREPFRQGEPVLEVDTAEPLDEARVRGIAAAIVAFRPSSA